MKDKNCANCDTLNLNNAKYCSQCGYELPKLEVDKMAIETIAEKPKNKRAKIIPAVVGVLAFMISYWGVQQLFSTSIEKELREAANELNKNCPVMIDSETRLDNTMVIDAKTFQYNYTLVGMEIATIDTVDFNNYMEPSIVLQTKSNPQLEFVRKGKVTLNYLYKDKNGAYISMIRVTPDKYQ